MSKVYGKEEYNGIKYTVVTDGSMFGYRIPHQKQGRSPFTVDFHVAERLNFLSRDLACDAAIDYIGGLQRTMGL